MKNWKVPAIILAVLIIAMAFRWTNDKLTTTNNSIIKYKTDNWNGAVYQDTFGTYYYEKIIGRPHVQMDRYSFESNSLNMAWYSSQGLTIAWGIMLTGSILWLLIAVGKTKKVEVNKDHLKT